jgi:aldehyde:ferredoxin oxidoreductase
LKKAGYDGIVLTGSSKAPCYVFIHDGRVQILDASFLWGKGAYKVRDALRKVHGRSVRFITTGPAGENMCRSATVMTDHEGSATGGFGAVMGSKRLKAVAVLGTGKVTAARPEELTELNRRTIHLSKRGTLRMPLPKGRMRYVKKAPCHQCGLDCLRGLFRTASGREAVLKCHSMAFYMPWVMAVPDEEIDTAIDATQMCNDLSLCTMEVDNILSWLHRCSHSGYLSEKETGLDVSRIGRRDFFQQLVKMIAYRQGFGDTLAEGLLRAGTSLGRTAREHFTESVSGVGLGSPYSPREYIINALLYAMEPRQPMSMLHEVSYLMARWLLHRIKPELSPVTNDVFRSAAALFWGHDEAWDMRTYNGKAEAAMRIQDRASVKDSLVLCDCAWPIMDSFNTPDHVGDPTLESRLFSAVTGLETDESGLLKYGERIFNLQRAILLREGWKAIEWDTPGEFNFTVPLQYDILNPDLIVPGPGEEVVSVRGNILDREKFSKMRAEYYDLRGWEQATGFQKTETLGRLNLGDLAKDLKERGLLI